MAIKSQRVFVFIAALLSQITSIAEIAVTLDFFVVTQNEFLVVPIGIGSPIQNFNLVLDIGAERSWISQEILQNATSSSLRLEGSQQEKTHEHFSYFGTPATDTLQLNSTTLDAFSFVYVEKYEGVPPFEGVLSIGNLYDRREFSLIDKLQDKSLVSSGAFTLAFKDMNKGTISIGDSHRDMEHLKHSCLLINSPPAIKWKCQLTHIFISSSENSASTSISIEAPAYFETVYNRIFAPINFIRYLQEKLFVDKENKPFCSVIQENSVTKFQCSHEEVNAIERLNFVFDSSLNLFLNKDQLFDCLETCTFVVMNDEKIDHWVMGLPMLRNYQTVFDASNQVLSFYGSENKALVTMPGGAKKVMMGILVVIMVIISIGSLGIGFIYFFRKKNDKKRQMEEKLYSKGQ